MASSGSESEFEVEKILAVRKRGRAVEYLVRWKEMGEDEDSWELEKNLDCKEIMDAFKDKNNVPKSPGRPKKTDIVQPLVQPLVRRTTRTTRSSSGTTTTTTTTSSMSKKEIFSDDSDNEAGTKVVQSSRTEVSEVVQQSSASPAKPPAKKWFSLPCVSCCAHLKCLKSEMPLVVFVSCMLFIGATFVWEKMYK